MGNGDAWRPLNPGTDKPHTEFSAKSYNHTPLPGTPGRSGSRPPRRNSGSEGPSLFVSCASAPQCAPRHWLGPHAATVSCMTQPAPIARPRRCKSQFAARCTVLPGVVIKDGVGVNVNSPSLKATCTGLPGPVVRQRPSRTTSTQYYSIANNATRYCQSLP